MKMRWIVSVWVVLLCLPAVEAGAQDIDELDEGVVMETPFEPGIEPNAWEIGIQIGLLDLASTLVDAKGIVVDVEDPQQAIFADMSLSGETSFHPQLRVSRTFGRHFALENTFGFSLGDFSQSIGGKQEKWVDPNSRNEVTEFELEVGSYFVWMHEHSLTWYPRGDGRIQPFLTAGAGTSHYSLDSTYIKDTAGSFAYSIGGGLRVVGDDLYSFRIEVRNYFSSVDYDVDPNFVQIPNLTADGLVKFPVSQLVDRDQVSQEQFEEIMDRLDLDPDSFASTRIPVPSSGFETQDYSNLWVSVGFLAAF